MAATPQSQAIGLVGDELFVAQQLQQAIATVRNHVAQYVATNVSAAWLAMATAPANADGSLGTADGTPNNAHPIDTRVAGLAALPVPLSANNLVSMEAIFQLLLAFFDGTGSTIPVVNRGAVLNQFRAG